jgi:lipoyl(octanoyl) transferase
MLRIPRDVSVHLFRRDEGSIRFLMLRRTPARGGFWQRITGAPLRGETDEAAAVREVLEETGWDVTGSIQPLDVSYSYALRDELRDHWNRVYGPDVAEVAVVSFAAEAPTELDPTLEPREHDCFGWFQFEEAVALLDWPVEHDALPHRRAALRTLLKRLGGGDPSGGGVSRDYPLAR